MIKNILFDCAGVLLDFSPETVLRRLGVPGEDVPVLCREVFGSAEWIALQRRGVTLEEAADRIGLRLPMRLRSWAGLALSDWWKYPLEGVPGMEELAAGLKELGYRLILFANADRSIHLYAQRIPGIKLFDSLFASADWKLLKPEPAIYDALLGSLGLTSWECLLIDAVPANVDGARRVDMDAVLFTGDMARLRSELNALGVPVKLTGQGA